MPVRWFSAALTFPNHDSEALHGFVMGTVIRTHFQGQLIDRSLHPWGLIDAVLFAQTQMHGQVKEWIGFAVLYLIHAMNGFGLIAEVIVVFGVKSDPVCGQGFHGVHGQTLALFGQHRTKKTSDVGLGG